KQQERKITELQQQLAAQAGSAITDQIESMNGVHVLVAKLSNTDPKSLRGLVDDLKNQIGEGIVLLGVAAEGKVSLIAGVTKQLTGRVKAGDLVNVAASVVGGKGGGRPDMAQAGGTEVDKLDDALSSAKDWLKGVL